MNTWNNEILDIYFQDIADSKPLTAQEEVELARRIKAGDEDARNQLVAANLRFVVKVATEYQGCGLGLEDLISAGNVGLIQATERFDETKGFKFITYAHWWIRQSIFNSISQESRMVRLPANRVKLLNSIASLLKNLGNTNIEDPTPERIAEELGVSVDMVEDTLMRAQDVYSLDAPVSEEDDRNPLNALTDHTQALPDALVSESSDRNLIYEVLDTLNERESEVLRLHFGLEDEQPRTLAKIGKRLGLTKERVRQIKEKALSKLRHPRRRASLAPLMESI